MEKQAEAAEEVRTTTILDYIVRTDTNGGNSYPDPRCNTGTMLDYCAEG